MKKAILFFIVFILNYSAGAFPKIDKLYLEAGFVTSTSPIGSNLGLTYGLGNRNFISFSLIQNCIDAKNIPADFHDADWLSFGLGDDLPHIKTKTYSILLGKNLLNSTANLRLIINCGTGLCYSESPVNFRWANNNTGGWFGPIGANYQWDTNIYILPCFIFKPTLEVPFGRNGGISLSVFCILNKDYSDIGINFNLLLGKVGRKWKVHERMKIEV